MTNIPRWQVSIWARSTTSLNRFGHASSSLAFVAHFDGRILLKARCWWGDVRVDPASGAVTKAGKELFLSALEYRLLLFFFQHKGKLVTREVLRDAIWDSAGEYVSDNALNVYVKRLREKIETDPSEPEIIITVRGLGYKVGE